MRTACSILAGRHERKRTLCNPGVDPGIKTSNNFEMNVPG
jgi:hypothetical protein